MAVKATPCVIVAVLLLAGCGADKNDAARPQRTAAATGVVPKDVAGTWTRRFARPQVASQGFPTGLYTMRLHDNTVEVWLGDDADPDKDCVTQELCEQHDVNAHGKILTIGETTLCTEPGDYSFEAIGNKLKTRKVKDDCDARPVIFDRRTWTRQK
jgi:hypothetical protein